MDTSHPTASWEAVGDSFYRKVQLYTAVFDRDLDLDNYIVAGAPYSGAVALCRDETKIVAYKARQATQPTIQIHSCAGQLLQSIRLDRSADIRGLGWSEDEKLLVVTRDGTVRCYTNFQGDFTQFSLGHGAEEYGVESCRFYDTGMVALLSNNALVAVSSYEEPRPKLLAACPSGSEVHGWAVVGPSHTLSRTVEVLLSVGSTVYVVDATDCEDRYLDAGPFGQVRTSPNGKFVALFSTNTSTVHVVTSDFQTRLSEHRTKSKIAPLYMEWCGNDAVVLAWEDEVQVIGPGGEDMAETARFLYDSRIHLLPDLDGVRVLSNDVCDFVHKVPDVTDEVFRLGTESPASVLLDAVEQLALQSPKADDDIQLIRPRLVEAVDACVNAAGQEFSVHWQKQLLRAASLGKSVLDVYNSDDFVEMCETLRVLNAVRFYDVGLPLSYDQYQRLGPDGLLRRLLRRHQHFLALRIADYLQLPTDTIYVHWACAKVRSPLSETELDDDALCRQVVSRLSGKPGISYEAIARAAYDEGRGRLATALLNHEPRAGRQVPLLLSMEEDDLALDKAVESGDTDLICYVVEQLRSKLPLAGFFRAVSRQPTAVALVEAAAARDDDTTLLKDLYYQDDRRLAGAAVFVREALRQPDSRTASDKLVLAGKLLADDRKEAALELTALKEATTLLRMQEALDRDLPAAVAPSGSGSGSGCGTNTTSSVSTPTQFVGLSVQQTLFQLERLGFHGRAKKIQSEFRVPDRVAWWLRLRALVAKRDWAEIEDWVQSAGKRSSPIGWEPFYRLVLQAGNPRLAGSVLVPKCIAAGSLAQGAAIEMYEACGMRVAAAQEAVKHRDVDAWTRLLEAAGRSTSEGREIQQLGQHVFKK